MLPKKELTASDLTSHDTQRMFQLPLQDLLNESYSETSFDTALD